MSPTSATTYRIGLRVVRRPEAATRYLPRNSGRRHHQRGAVSFRRGSGHSPWQWLYGRHLLRGEVPDRRHGRHRKKLAVDRRSLAMASCRPLLGEEVPAPLRVVLVNLEDTRNTMDKRIAAIIRQYGLTPPIRQPPNRQGQGRDQNQGSAANSRSGDVERNERSSER